MRTVVACFYLLINILFPLFVFFVVLHG